LTLARSGVRDQRQSRAFTGRLVSIALATHDRLAPATGQHAGTRGLDDRRRNWHVRPIAFHVMVFERLIAVTRRNNIDFMHCDDWLSRQHRRHALSQLCASVSWLDFFAGLITPSR
jgi:hypothetical protein